MSFEQIIRTVFEIVLIVFTLWAVFHEDIFAAFEERVVAAFKRRRLKVVGRSYRTIR